MALSFFERTSPAEYARQLTLASYTPELTLSGLTTGIDNVRHDVFLSPKFIEISRGLISLLIEKHGGVESLLQQELAKPTAMPLMLGPRKTAPTPANTPPKPADRPAEFKKTLAELHVVALNYAKAEGNICIDVLVRLAIIKLLKSEMLSQFNQVSERCRARIKQYEGRGFANKALELRECFMKLQVSKKIVLRKIGQELFATFREIEKETVARMRRSLFGDTDNSAYELFLNRLIFSDDPCDEYLCAEHYVMLGSFERDPDRFELMCAIVCDFLSNLGFAENVKEASEYLDAVLSVPENANELMGAGSPIEGPKAKAQRALLAAWTNGLEQAEVIQNVIASYEVLPLLGEYCPLINPQQLKNALISRTERKRVEQLLEQHGKISPERIQQAVKRVEGYSGGDRMKVAGRFLSDLMRYHKDFRRLEAVNAGLDSVNVIVNDKLRELSAINNTLYECLLPEEQKPAEDKVIDHIILKADIRDSTTLTRTLFARGLNPASYFSLNFYEPVNKLLPKYEATKVFIEGDAVILAMFEREGEAGFGVARACTLAQEMMDIVNAYNEKSIAAGLPALEIGIGICFQNSAPMYLMDGNNRIMISKALNESDRLSGCSKGSRKYIADKNVPFKVFSFQTVDDKDTGGIPDEFLMRYNVGGIHINEVAFQKLQQEISLQEQTIRFPMLWGPQDVKLFTGLVPVTAGVFHRIIVREGIIPRIDATNFTLTNWTDRKYYEICTSQLVYDETEKN